MCRNSRSGLHGLSVLSPLSLPTCKTHGVLRRKKRRSIGGEKIEIEANDAAQCEGLTTHKEKEREREREKRRDLQPSNRVKVALAAEIDMA